MAGVDETARRRKRGTRADTESDLVDAALRVLEAKGVLSAFPIRDVAAEAGVNHGQIYQYFGSREALLRAAIWRTLQQRLPDLDQHWDKPFAERRRFAWEWALSEARIIQLEALLALEDGDAGISLFPNFAQTQLALERDKADGALPPDADGEVMHVMTAAVYQGYCLFRDEYARTLGVPVEDLDRRATVVFEKMLRALVTDDDSGAGPTS